MLDPARTDRLPRYASDATDGTAAATGSAVEQAAESVAVPLCRHRGQRIGTTGCRTCGGVQNLPLYQCSVNTTCTTIRRAVDDEITFCGDCRWLAPVWYTRSTQQLQDDLISWSERLPELSGVCGIPRSGVTPAALLALIRNIPLVSYDALRSGDNSYRRPDGRRLRSVADAPLLILDDTSWTGNAMRRTRNELLGDRLLFGAVYAGPRGRRKCDVWGVEIDNWHHVFEWNVARDVHSQSAMLDLDGVISPDPPHPYDFPDESQTPAESYLQFLDTAVPQRWPGFRVDTICTARLERFRRQTEAWLAKHNIEYRQLIMHPATTWQARERQGHAEFKAEHYAASRCTLFVESRPEQARRIHQLTGRPVISTKPWHVYQ